MSPFAIGKPAALFTLPASVNSFDVAPDGRFLIVVNKAASVADELRIVLAWSGIRSEGDGISSRRLKVSSKGGLASLLNRRIRFRSGCSSPSCQRAC